MYHSSLSTLSRNGLLRTLSREDLELLHPLLEPVSLSVGDVLVEPNEPIAFVHFMEQGIASVVAFSQAKKRIEVATLGREGLAGVSIVLDIDRSPHLTFIQVTGSALRMRAGDLRAVMGVRASLRNLLLHYAHALSIQTAHTALANGRFTITERLARWILMSHDRLDSNDVPLTHNLLALMLGVRRPGVTMALHILEGKHMIRSTRGHVTLLDRVKLERLAGDSYGVPEAEYRRVIGSEVHRRPPLPKAPVAA
jgi:CRP-like cAMP-binding protein